MYLHGQTTPVADHFLSVGENNQRLNAVVKRLLTQDFIIDRALTNFLTRSNTWVLYVFKILSLFKICFIILHLNNYVSV